MRVGAGELDQRVTLQRVTEAPNAEGTIVETVTALASVWAKVRRTGGNETDHAQQTDARTRYVVIIRSRTDLHPRDRILWNGVTLNIRDLPQATSREPFLMIEAEAGVL